VGWKASWFQDKRETEKYQGGNSAGDFVKGVTFHTGKEGTSCMAICKYPNALI